MLKESAKTISNEEFRSVLDAIFGRIPDPKLDRATTALVIIDVQYGCAHPDWGLGRRAKEQGVTDALDYYWDRVQRVLVPNIQLLIATARRIGIEIIHVHVASATADGRDMPGLFKTRNVSWDSQEAQFLLEVAPHGDELVLSKTTSSAFDSTNIDMMLRNIGIRNLIMTGIETSGCVDSTVRSAAAKGYGMIVVEDACAAKAPQLHDVALLGYTHKFAVVKSTDEVVQLLEALED